MTTLRAPRANGEMRAAQRLGRALQAAACLVLLACVASRPFLTEMPFRTSLLKTATLSAAQPSQDAAGLGVAREELAGVSFSMAILAAMAAWLVGAAILGRLEIRCGWLAVGILAFAGLSLISALSASDKRGALDAWFVQTTLLCACFLAAQLCVQRRWRGLLVVVLAGVAGSLAAKGLYQFFVEVPERVADFQMYRAERLAQFGWAIGSPQAQHIEKRLTDPAPFGYFALANPFASLLIVVGLTAVGLTADKIVAARRECRALKSPEVPTRRGQVHLPTLAAILTGVMTAACGAVLVLTRSRGAIVAAGTALAGGAAVLVFHKALARHFRKIVIVLVVALVLGLAGVGAYGWKFDRLPTRTMTLRWYYWSAAAQIVRDHPLLGVGPGNFASAYLAYRRPEAQESVKTPHNVIVHALTQLGLPGGSLLLLILGGVLACMCRPTKVPTDLAARAPPLQSPARVAGALAVVVAVMLVAKATFDDYGGNAYLLVFSAVFPAAVLAVALTLACWAGGRLSDGLEVPGMVARVGLAAGCLGFALHNMVTYSFWMPGAAMAFWAAAGAGLAYGTGRTRNLTRLRWPVAAAGVLVLVAAAVVLWWPVCRRLGYSELSAAAFASGDTQAGVDWACRAGRADPLDAVSAADAARAIRRTSPRGDAQAFLAHLERAMDWATLAVARDPANPAYRRLAGRIAWELAAPDSFAYARRMPTSGLAEYIKLMRARLARRPKDALALADLAYALRAKGDTAEAIDTLRRAILADPEAQTLHVLSGNWRYSLGEPAEGPWLWARDLAPRNRWVDRALEYMGKAIELNPQECRDRLEYARMLCDANRPMRCLAQLEAAQELDRRVPPDSAERLSPHEQQEAESLRARAELSIRAR